MVCGHQPSIFPVRVRISCANEETMADEEPVCVMPEIRKACEPKCSAYFEKYQACVDRIKAKGVGACDGQYFDFLHCVDKCSVPQIMKHLK